MNLIFAAIKNLKLVSIFLKDLLNSSLIEISMKKKESLESVRTIKIKTGLAILSVIGLVVILFILRHFKV